VKKFDQSMIDNFVDISMSRKPDFNNLLKVLDKKKPDRYTLFEFFLNEELYMRFSRAKEYPKTSSDYNKMRIDAFRGAGYDYCTLSSTGFYLKNNANQHNMKSRSMNECSIIEDRETFDQYIWNNPEDFDMDALCSIEDYIPEGMKIIVNGPGGVLENVMQILGYDNMCYLLADDPQLVQDVFDHVGSRLLKYYEMVLPLDFVGAYISNDDWGFNTQTMMSVEDMRKYVFPWHKRIVDAVHGISKPVILHSCGNLKDVYDDIIDNMKFDAKHSYEDLIQPIEKAYEQYNPRIALVGGIDVDFMVRRSPEEIYNRSCAMLLQTESRGGYALGTGNSVPTYIPAENYIAMAVAAVVNSL